MYTICETLSVLASLLKDEGDLLFPALQEIQLVLSKVAGLGRRRETFLKFIRKHNIPYLIRD